MKRKEFNLMVGLVSMFLGASLVIITLCVVGAAWHQAHNQDHASVKRISNSSVSVECEDEREPVVTTFENTTHITVTCK